MAVDEALIYQRARPINLRLEDAPVRPHAPLWYVAHHTQALRLPSELDDDYITATGFLPQPSGRTALLSGFNVATNLFR
jgi:hypothetical protein